MKPRPLSIQHQRAAVKVVRALGEDALPILRRIVNELDKREADRRLLRLVEADAASSRNVSGD